MTTQETSSNNTSINTLRASARKVADKKEKAEKTKKNLYLSPCLPLSYNNINNFVYTAVRGIGKSVISVETAIILKRKYGYENVKCYYFRLTDLSIKAMLANHAAKAVDPYLIQKYNLEITSRNNIVYDHGKPLLEFYPLVSAGSKGKGAAFYDCNYLNNRPINPKTGKPIKRFIVTIWDEFLMAEGIEKKSVGDPVAQYRIYMEAILRDQERITDYNAIYNFFLANNVSECANVTGQLFNYIPDPNNHKIVKLSRKHTIFWNVPITDAYVEKRKKSYNADILNYKDDPNYAEVARDLSMIKPKKTRIRKVTMLIKFSKYKADWFCLYDGKYIRKYANECVNPNLSVGMKRHIDEIFQKDVVDEIFAIYDSKSFMYADLISMATFQAKMKELKAK